jgi:hypothetical protein
MPDNTPAVPQTNQAQATALLSQVPFRSVIAGPLSAAVEAQGDAAIASANFIRSVGFDANGKTVSVDFQYVKRSADGTSVTSSLTVPLLTIVPIPYIRIDDMTIAFKTSISATDSSSQKDTQSTSVGAKVEASAGWGPFKASLSGSYSSKKDSSSTRDSKYSVEYTLDVQVHAKQDDMPAGMAKVLGILSDAITATNAPAPAPAN